VIARREPSRRTIGLMWIGIAWVSAAYVATACAETGRFHSMHVLGIAVIVCMTPAALSLSFWESMASLGGSLAAWIIVTPIWKVPPEGADLSGLATSLLYMSSITGVTIASLAFNRRLRYREFVARRQVEELHRFAVEEVLCRHLPPRYVEDVLKGAHLLDAPPERRLITVVFADIVSFTPLSDTLRPEELASAIARFYDVTSTIAFEHGATIDKFIGDAVMAILGAPEPMSSAEQARRAVELAIEWQRAVALLTPGGRALQLRIGVHQDTVAVGAFGGKRRTDYTVLGKGVNIAARLEQACPHGKILVSRVVWDQLPDPKPDAVDAGPLALKGVPEMVAAFTISPKPITIASA
jgi:class 3 adenylate cyclase